MNPSAEQALEGGNVAKTVVRVGSTVRKPASATTAAVEALLDHFADVGFSGTPRSLGRDELGRHVLEYVPGEMANTLPPLSAIELRRLGAFIQEIHDVASRGTLSGGVRRSWNEALHHGGPSELRIVPRPPTNGLR